MISILAEPDGVGRPADMVGRGSRSRLRPGKSSAARPDRLASSFSGRVVPLLRRAAARQADAIAPAHDAIVAAILRSRMRGRARSRDRMLCTWYSHCYFLDAEARATCLRKRAIWKHGLLAGRSRADSSPRRRAGGGGKTSRLAGHCFRGGAVG